VATKAAIITGAGSGIGRATAVELSRAGCALTLVGRRRAELEATAALCGESLVVDADVSESSHCKRVASSALERYERVDVLIHCAGFAPVVRIDQVTDDLWRQIVDTNLSAAIYLASALWPTFRKQNSGVIVNISSESSRDPFIGLGAYGAAKAGVNLLGKALAAEGAEIGVRVHTIAPGAVETQMLRSIVSSEQFPTEKTLSTEDVAKVIVQCVQGDLRHTSGEVIYLHKSG
jgi:NAD(P)-dependent dehydrogenase (short-subunit alcohol dehydrogenase family)